MSKITLRNWIEQNELNFPSLISDDLVDTQGKAYADSTGAEWWVSPLAIVQSDTTGTRQLDKEDEERVREWIDVNNDRPHDRSKPNEIE